MIAVGFWGDGGQGTETLAFLYKLLMARLPWNQPFASEADHFSNTQTSLVSSEPVSSSSVWTGVLWPPLPEHSPWQQ